MRGLCCASLTETQDSKMMSAPHHSHTPHFLTLPLGQVPTTLSSAAVAAWDAVTPLPCSAIIRAYLPRTKPVNGSAPGTSASELRRVQYMCDVTGGRLGGLAWERARRAWHVGKSVTS